MTTDTEILDSETPDSKTRAAVGPSSPINDDMDATQMAEAAAEASGLLRLLANTNRLMILCFLLGHERSVGQMEEELGIRQPTLSQQIAILREARLISQSRREAKVVFYELRDPKVIPVIRALYGVFCAGTEPVSMVAAEQTADTPADASAYASVAPAAGSAVPSSAKGERALADCGVMAVLNSR